jgi:two-component system sensor histidine kinase and response regulator WspE
MDSDQFSLLDLFRVETETQAQVVTAGLLALERDHALADQLEACMRAVHSLKGAARIVNLSAGVRVAHAMEDCFVAAQKGHLALRHAQIDLLLAATDLLSRIAHTPEAEMEQWASGTHADVERCLVSLAGILAGEEDPAAAPTVAAPAAGPADAARTDLDALGTAGTARDRRATDRVLRVTAENLNRLLSLAGESMVESRWVQPFAESILRLKRLHHQLGKTLERAREISSERSAGGGATLVELAEAGRQLANCEELLARRLVELEMFDRRSINLAHRLYEEALTCRMRPFADGVEAFPRAVRDLAQALGRSVRLEVVGGSTQVDRDILARLDGPLGHLVRNAVDHGIEPPEARRAAGKPAEGVVRIEARHSAGALQITVSDDGRGVDLERLRQAVVARNLTTHDAALALSEPELLAFLFLPGFTMKGTVTDVSGRGVGLDAVQDMVKEVRGTIRVTTELGKGTRFQLQLPVTLSVVRTLLADIGGEPYAFPLACIVRTLKLSSERIARLEGRQHFDFDGRQIGLVLAHQVLAVDTPPTAGEELPVIVIGQGPHLYGLVVDRFLGERELVVQTLDPQLGKIKDIAAGALMEDGSPVLIIDPDDLLRSMDRLASGERLDSTTRGAGAGERRRKRVLVVDDSLTVRELERKLIGNAGYEVEVAVDGMDGWNAVRTGHFDLVVSDIDMPRMDGIEFVTLMNKDPNLKTIPVMIVSYKDRDEDRRRGLEAGAAYYLTKGSFHDESLLQAIVDLIGEANG